MLDLIYINRIYNANITFERYKNTRADSLAKIRSRSS